MNYDMVDSASYYSPKFRKVLSYTYIIVALALYIYYWSNVSIAKYLSLHDHVFDLGIAAQRGWVILHTNLGLHKYLMTLLNSGIVFILSPLTGAGNYYAILLFQVFVVGLVGLALFRTSRIRGLSLFLSCSVMTAYLLYYPIYGIFWYDFHYQVMFLPLFVFGYMFYVEGKYSISLILFILAGMVRFPYSIFPLGFAIIEIVYLFTQKGDHINVRPLRMLITLALVMLFFTLLGLFFLGGLSTVNLQLSSIASTYNASSVDTRIFTIFLFLAPLLFLPVLSVRWIVLTLPFFYVIMTSGYFGYTYPFILQDQYVSGLVPFIFLGLIESINKFKNWRSKNQIEKSTGPESGLKKRTPNIKFAALLLIVLVSLNLVYAPFGPYNSDSADNFYLQEKTAYNSTVHSELSSMLSMIPYSSPYVVYQDNLPQVLPRTLPYNSTLLLTGYLGNILEFNISNVISNEWPVDLHGGKNIDVPIDYAIADPRNANFYYGPVSMYDIVSSMYESGKYGILSEGAGLVLLARGYDGHISNYIPQNISYHANLFTNYLTNSSGQSTISVTNDINGLFMFYGPGTYLFPGNYTASFSLSTSSLNANNSFWVQVTADYGSKLISDEQIRGNYFNNTNKYQGFAIKFHVSNILGEVEFRGLGIQWSGVISFEGVKLNQNSPS